MKPHDYVEKQLKVSTSIVIGMLGFLVSLLLVFLPPENFPQQSMLSGQIIGTVVIIIFSTLYSIIVGYFFSREIIRWLKIKSNCYFRAFSYGVLGGLATIVLTVGTIGGIIGIIAVTARVLSGAEHIPIIDMISQSFMGVMLGSLMVLMWILSEPLIWAIFFVNGMFGILALLFYRKQLDIK